MSHKHIHLSMFIKLSLHESAAYCSLIGRETIVPPGNMLAQMHSKVGRHKWIVCVCVCMCAVYFE
jgi:hypothetical protein